MGVHEGHRQRLMEEYLANGLDGFAPHKVLELLLFFAVPRKDTNELAHRLISTFGSLSAVLDAPYEELIRVEGVGRHTAVLLSMIPQLFREYRKDLLSRLPLNSSRDAGIHMMAHFAGLQQEHVALVCLDAKNRIISTQMLQEGGITEVQVSIRRVMATALQNSAVSVILGHNHPGGLALPSTEDIYTTQKVRDVLASVGIRLQDHIIVADGDYVSLADSGAI